MDGNIAEILGIRLNGTKLVEVLKRIYSRLESKQKTFLVTPNPEFIVYARKYPWFGKILNSADISIPDGIGLLWASRLLGKPLRERISGTDLMEKLCLEATRRGWTVYLFGGDSGVADEALKALKKRSPKLRGWANSGPQKLKIDEKWVNDINRKKPDLLFVCLGMGKQEKFIFDNWQKLEVGLAMGVGGAFDYLSNRVKRAPKWVQELGLEWLCRLVHQPWRLRRQLALVKFIWLVLKEKFAP